MPNPDLELSHWLATRQAAAAQNGGRGGMTRRKGVVTQTAPLLVATGEGVGLPAVNISGAVLTVGQTVWLDVWDGHRQVIGQHTTSSGGGAGGGWETIWKDEAGDPVTEGLPGVQLNGLNVAAFDDYSSLRLTVLYIGGVDRPVNRSLVELSGFGQLTPATVALDPGEEYSIVMEADRHVHGFWSARIHDVAPAGAVSGRAAAETVGAWQNFANPDITVTVWPLGGARYVSGWLYGLPYQED